VGTWWQEHDASPRGRDDASMARSVLPAHLVDLLDAVEARFVATSTTPGWPDPHADATAPWPGRRDPSEEEYSRVTDPARYRILHERAEAWLDELVARDLGRVDEIDSGRAWLLVHHHHGVESLRVVVPMCAGAQPLVLELWDPRPGLPAGVRIGAGVPAVLLDMNPYCGCDACDDGSARLLQQLDEWLLRVLDGSLRVEVSVDSTRLCYADGSSATEGFDAAERRARRSRLGSQPYTLVGKPWHSDWPSRAPTAGT
jgi:hypothetical protein